MRAQPVFLPVCHRRDDQLVRAGQSLQRGQPLGDLVGVTDELRLQPVFDDGQLFVGERTAILGSWVIQRIGRRRELFAYQTDTVAFSLASVAAPLVSASFDSLSLPILSLAAM